MTRFLKLFPLVVTLMLLAVLGNTTGKPQPGCATPKEVLPREIAAIQHNDKIDLAMCFSAYVRINPETAHKGSDPIALTRDVQKTIIAGVKKYGAKDFAASLGSMRSFLVFSWMTTQQEIMLKKGKFTVKGDKATYTCSGPDKPDATYYAQAELKAYDRLFHYPNITNSSTLTLEKVNGRWYEAMSREDADSAHLAYTLLSDYLPAVNKGIRQSANAKALAKYLIEANKKFDTTMSPPKTGAIKK